MAAMTLDSVLDLGKSARRDGGDDGPGPAAFDMASARFALAPTGDPAAYSRAHCGVGYGTDAHQEVKFAKGTTTLAFKFNGGVIISVDSRSTMGPRVGRRPRSNPALEKKNDGPRRARVSPGTSRRRRSRR